MLLLSEATSSWSPSSKSEPPGSVVHSEMADSTKGRLVVSGCSMISIIILIKKILLLTRAACLQEPGPLFLFLVRDLLVVCVLLPHILDKLVLGLQPQTLLAFVVLSKYIFSSISSSNEQFLSLNTVTATKAIH